MALSSCSNWALPPPPPPMHHYDDQLLLQDPEPFDLPFLFPCDASASDSLLHAVDAFFSDGPDDGDNTLPAAHFPSACPDNASVTQDLRIPAPAADVHWPKRQKTAAAAMTTYTQQPYALSDELLSALLSVSGAGGIVPPTSDCFLVAPEFAVPAAEFCIGSGGGDRKGSGAGASAQSVAARQRRKRISDKTQELGRMVPGGNKMNTAEMFQAAARYVKFLQAQVAVLRLLSGGQPQVKKEGSPPSAEREGEQEMQSLLGSLAVQEKLYRAERCIVPAQWVDDLAKDSAVRSHPAISRDLGRFMDSVKKSKDHTPE